MKTKKILFLFLILTMMLLVACSENSSSNNEGKANDTPEKEDTENFNKTGMPIVDEPITLKFMAGKSPSNTNNYNDVLIWKEYKKLTNIEIDWELVPTEGLTEKRNLALAGGNLPDVFYTAHVSNSDLLKYGEQGTFVALNDLIEEYMPNLTKLLEEDPKLRAGMTFPDGNIYSLPTIHDAEYLEVRLGMMFWIRQDWLDKLDMKLPETTDEFYDYLKAVKETDLFGDGSGNEIPYGAFNIGGLKDVLKGSFGIGNKGHANQYVDLDPETNEPRFFPISEGYKEMLEYMHKLYSEGLIQENIFTIDTNQSFADGADGLYGSTVIASPNGIYGEEGKNFVGMNALEGPHGDRQVTRIGSTLNSIGGFVVTSSNEHIPETLRWMDYFYSDEGARLYFMGVEGETYEVDEDGEIDYTDEFYNNPDGLTFDQTVGKYFTWLGGGYPGIIKREFFKGNSADPASVEAADRVRPYVEDIWPHFLLTAEENKKMSSLAADIEKYTDEMFNKFVAGDESLSNWDKYVESVEKMGLDEYMQIYNDAYGRFLEEEN
ncbi:extracellular solute-binding protein [Bacillus sp. SD088]|uniref:extracellular solute-binding protein n=1 Tax=Bacillus sp. SD088 TaxID=2782012 RepID=UPI001A975864|nr:extracellular solute-binding protein [Bacillus sp. SD088]MBO0991961.1 extracellular solute-binding protein [Bacillus sp. SD088]